MWEMHHAVKRATKHRDDKGDEEEEACQSAGDDEVSGSDGEDVSQGTSIIRVTTIPHNLHWSNICYVEASGSTGRQAKKDAAWYNEEKAAAVAAGPKAFDVWASGVAAKGYGAITSLRQKISNDQTRANAAADASDSLDAFVHLFFQFIYYCPCKAPWPKLTIDYLQAHNAWTQYGLAIVGFLTGAAAPMPSSYKGRWIFGLNDEVKNVFYNGALQHSVQQLYMSTGILCILVSKVPMHHWSLSVVVKYILVTL